MSAPLLQADFNAGYGKQAVLQEIQFELHPGDKLGLVGTSGTGKTTLALALMGPPPLAPRLDLRHGPLRRQRPSRHDRKRGALRSWQAPRPRPPKPVQRSQPSPVAAHPLRRSLESSRASKQVGVTPAAQLPARTGPPASRGSVSLAQASRDQRWPSATCCPRPRTPPSPRPAHC